MRSLALWLFVLTTAAAPCAQAQGAAAGVSEGETVPERAFATLRVEASGVLPLAQSQRLEAWTPGEGLAASVTTPFYAGYARLGAQYVPYAAAAEVPDFRATLLFAEFGGGVGLLLGLRASAGVRFGIARIYFDDETLIPTARSEQEFAAYAVVGLARSFGAWTLRTEASAGSVFLSEPWRQAFASASLGYTLATPRWLREVLR